MMKMFFYLLFVVFSRCSHFFLKFIIKKNVDIIIISKPINIALIRSKFLASKIKDKGMSVKVLSKSKLNLLFFSGLGNPRFVFSLDSVREEVRKSYARGLRVYKSKLIIQFDDCWPYSKFIKMLSGAKLINIAHGVTGSSIYFNIIDYDYYFIYGQSSIDALSKNKFILSGSTKLIKIGPIFSDFEINKDINNQDFIKRHFDGFDWRYSFVYSSSFTGDREIQSLIESSHGILVSYCERNPDVLVFISLHPLEKLEDYWFAYKDRRNIVILPPEISKEDIAPCCSFHLTMFSNSIIDYGLLGLDTIIIRKVDYGEEYLSLSNFFKIAKSPFDLESIIYSYRRDDSRLGLFLDYHCEYTDRKSIVRVVDSLEVLCGHGDVDGVLFEVK